MRPSIGLIGRIVAILLLAILVEFGASTALYERASEFSVRDDEARRLAEHLFIARRLVVEHPPQERSAMAAALSTERYAIAWSPTPRPARALTQALDGMRDQIIAWEPSLATANPRVRLIASRTGSMAVGELRLADGSWLNFRMREPVRRLDFWSSRILLAMALSVMVMILAGALIRRTLRPMRQLAVAADRFGTTEQEPLPEAGPGEVRRVISAFNRMQARIHRLIADRTQALAAVGHDLRTPLARLRLRTDRVGDAELRDTIQEDLAEMEAMVASLLAFLGGESDPEPAMLTDLAILCATLAYDAADHGKRVVYDGPDHLDLTVRPSSLKRALVNLIENALHHGDAVTLTLRSEPGGVAIQVEDDGPGIPEESLQQVLEPFVRLDTARRRDTVGFGLGLAIVARAVEIEGGTLTLSNRSEGGLRAEILLNR